MLGRAIEIAVEAHSGQVDKGGKPYILHPLWVMNQVRHLGEDYMITAILHDVLEDSSWSAAALMEEGFTYSVVNSVVILTKLSTTKYDDYIKNVSLDPKAKAVKMKDLEHNTKITRLKGLRKKDFDRLEKYHRAYTYLKD